jgi:hypothetical protein
MAKRRKSKPADVPPAAVPDLPVAPAPEVPPPATDTRFRRLIVVALGWAMLAGLLLFVHHLTTQGVSPDEHHHLQFLWLTSQGILPQSGFLCPYPPTAYYAFAPSLRFLPQTPESFVLVRAAGLVPLAVWLGSLALIARHMGRHPALLTVGLVAMLATGTLPAFFELRFDLAAWGLAMLAFALLLRSERRGVLALASGLVLFSLMLSPKHIVLAAGIAVAVATVRLVWHRPGFWRDLVAALAGAAVPLLLFTLIRGRFVLDLIELTMLNVKTQLDSTYEVTLGRELPHLLLNHPFATLPIWAAPVLFLLNIRSLAVRDRILFGGLFVGALGNIAVLKCGYDQYLALVWALLAPFALWLTPAPRERALVLAQAVGLLAIVAYLGGREAQTWSENVLARQVRFQQELARLCPPGEIAHAASFTHPWFRRNVGYAHMDNRPNSYLVHVRPEQVPLFSKAYFLKRLEESRPALIGPFAIYDHHPEAYTEATYEFLGARLGDYTLVHVPCDFIAVAPERGIPYYVRNDLAGRAVDARR